MRRIKTAVKIDQWGHNTKVNIKIWVMSSTSCNKWCLVLYAWVMHFYFFQVKMSDSGSNDGYIAYISDLSSWDWMYSNMHILLFCCFFALWLQQVMEAIREGVNPGNSSNVTSLWDLSSSFFFAGTVITTIGIKHTPSVTIHTTGNVLRK